MGSPPPQKPKGIADPRGKSPATELMRRIHYLKKLTEIQRDALDLKEGNREDERGETKRDGQLQL